MDPEKLNTIYSKVICSPAITRQNISRKSLTSPTIDNKNDEDDTQFFESLKKKINTGSLKCLQNKYESKESYITRKRKYNFHEETMNIIKRFKEAIEHKDHIEIDAIKLHAQAKEIDKDETAPCTCNNDILKSVNINVDNERYMLPRDFTIAFESEKTSTDKENNQYKFLKSNSMNNIENNSIKQRKLWNIK